MLRAETMHEIDLLERIHRRVRPRIHRGYGYVRRPELRAHSATAQPRDVGHQLRLAPGEVDRIEAAPLADGVGDVVVAVDEGDCTQDADSLGTVVLGG